MIIKEGSSAVPLYIKPRVNGVVITIAALETLYGGGSGVYTLVAELADKTDTEAIVGTADINGILFTLPSTMFDTAQRDWTALVKTVINGITDKSLYNFDIKVTKGDSVNSR